MWRHIKGVEPPAAKRPRMDEAAKKAADKEYEKTRRKRGFLPKWRQEFKWLNFDEDRGAMLCRVCVEMLQPGQQVPNYCL